MMSTDTEVRDAVIKLETQMEGMSASMASMADSISKLVDIKYELVAVKKDVASLQTDITKVQKDVSELNAKHTALDKAQTKNSYVIGKIELFWSALITGGAAFLWWLLKT
jgi:chromosome segregation ATPase